MLRPENTVERTRTEYITKTDTVIDIIKNYDTVFINNTKYRDIYHYDTIHHNELVYIRDTVHNYRFREPDYTLGINAVRLDNYKLDIHTRDTVTVEHYNTVETIVRKKDNRFGLGVYAGMGYDPYNKTFSPNIGLGLTFRLTK